MLPTDVLLLHLFGSSWHYSIGTALSNCIHADDGGDSTLRWVSWIGLIFPAAEKGVILV